MTPRWLFDERKAIAINLPFSNKNEHFSKKRFARSYSSIQMVE